MPIKSDQISRGKQYSSNDIEIDSSPKSCLLTNMINNSNDDNNNKNNNNNSNTDSKSDDETNDQNKDNKKYLKNRVYVNDNS